MSFFFLFRIFWRFSRNGILAFLMPDLPLARFFDNILTRRAMRQRSKGERLRQALTELGSSFIKFGQIMSVRPDLVGREIADELVFLQDKLPPFGAVERQIEASFGKPLSAFFSEFDPVPVAAASVAQVHSGVTIEGRKVAIKILRPGIINSFRRDIKSFFKLARLGERFVPRLRRLGAVHIISVYEEWTMRELDFTLEAASASELSENMAKEKGFHIPEIDWQRSNSTVLTMEWVEGVRLDDFAQLESWALDPKDLLRRAVDIFFLQVFRDGFFHADIHPGNLLITKAGTLTPVDFGITGRLDWNLRHFLAETLIGFVTRDYKRVSRAHFEAGLAPKDQSVESLTQICRAIGEPLFGKSLDNVSFANLMFKIISISDRFNLPVQMRLLLLHKTMLQAEGVGRMIDPNLNIWLLSKDLIGDWLRDNRSLRKRVKTAFKDFSKEARQIPHLIEKFDAFLETHQSAPSPSLSKPLLLASFCSSLAGGAIAALFFYFLL